MEQKKQSSGELALPLLSAGFIERHIYLIQKQKVMLDTDLAELYGVETFNFNKAVKRNIEWFPEDFMFQLTKDEAESLRFQIGMSNLKSQSGMSKLWHSVWRKRDINW